MGYIIKPRRAPVKHLDNKGIWYGITSSGQKIYMNAFQAQRWAHETGRPVFMNVKKYQLDELD